MVAISLKTGLLPVAVLAPKLPTLYHNHRVTFQCPRQPREHIWRAAYHQDLHDRMPVLGTLGHADDAGNLEQLGGVALDNGGDGHVAVPVRSAAGGGPMT